jgi:hypothetical protein
VPDVASISGLAHRRRLTRRRKEAANWGGLSWLSPKTRAGLCRSCPQSVTTFPINKKPRPVCPNRPGPLTLVGGCRRVCQHHNMSSYGY